VDPLYNGERRAAIVESAVSIYEVGLFSKDFVIGVNILILPWVAPRSPIAFLHGLQVCAWILIGVALMRVLGFFLGVPFVKGFPSLVAAVTYGIAAYILFLAVPFALIGTMSVSFSIENLVIHSWRFLNRSAT
jgi:hypothetical protein